MGSSAAGALREQVVMVRMNVREVDGSVREVLCELDKEQLSSMIAKLEQVQETLRRFKA
jgi:hypothetical protein